MGRSKAYDAKEKLEQARSLFHERGFSATSIADLVKHLGINRKSMYAEFGGKQALFEAALELHNDVNVARDVGPLESPLAGVPEIRSLLTTLGAAARGPWAGLGCLLCNTASERAAIDGNSREHVRSYIKRIAAAFRNALDNAQAVGDVHSSVDVEVEARFFASHVIGQLTLVRANVAPDVALSASAVAVDHLRSLERGTEDRR